MSPQMSETCENVTRRKKRESESRFFDRSIRHIKSSPDHILYHICSIERPFVHPIDVVNPTLTENLILSNSGNFARATMNKKVKTENEFEILRKHILACPDVSKDGKAMLAALQGLEQERKRMKRDAKLQAKFSQNASATSKVAGINENPNLPGDIVQVTKPRTITSAASTIENGEELLEWHDIPKQELDIDHLSDEGSLLGQQLAHLAISNMAAAQTTIGTPLAAIALALHAALRSTMLQFTCTGMPEKGPISGFAPPVRELPKAMFVPNNWDENASEISIRYRKNGVGSVVLKVTLSVHVQVQLVPTNVKEPPSSLLEFPIADHVNIDSLSAAFRKDKRVLPALHYKSLGVLLTRFCNSFDLGNVNDGKDSVGGSAETPLWDRHLPYVDATIRAPSPEILLMPPSSRPVVPLYLNDDQSPTIQVFHRQPNRGDFAGDILPAGIDPLGPSGGNLMGPGHPLLGGPSVPSGFGMMPRFDPFGPPGGPQDPDPTMRDPRLVRPRPGGLGLPNNDILRPPNNLSNNMFM
jgi:hypothetical protein